MEYFYEAYKRSSILCTKVFQEKKEILILSYSFLLSFSQLFHFSSLIPSPIIFIIKAIYSCLYFYLSHIYPRFTTHILFFFFSFIIHIFFFTLNIYFALHSFIEQLK